jgi:hypothetical protein
MCFARWSATSQAVADGVFARVKLDGFELVIAGLKVELDLLATRYLEE